MTDGTEQTICGVPEGTEPQDCTEEKTTFTLTEFKELVHSAQKGDREAINVLCTAFKPLIYTRRPIATKCVKPWAKMPSILPG